MRYRTSFFAIKSIATIVATIAGMPVFAHEGHGMSGNHWHATDTWGFVAVAGALALAAWLSRGGK